MIINKFESFLLQHRKSLSQNSVRRGSILEALFPFLLRHNHYRHSACEPIGEHPVHRCVLDGDFGHHITT